MDTIVHIEGDKYVGRTQFFPNLLKDALMLSVKEVRGVARLGKKLLNDKVAHKGIRISESKDSDELIIDIDLCIEYGNQVADVAYRVQEAVINTANQLTNKKVRKVNVHIRGTKYQAGANARKTAAASKKAENEPNNK